jgi:hypothetical protein
MKKQSVVENLKWLEKSFPWVTLVNEKMFANVEY